MSGQHVNYPTRGEHLDLTKQAEREKVWNRSDGICWYCGCKLNPFKFHIDHFVPRKLGGKSEYTNLVPSCPPCNTAKGAKPLEELRSSIWARQFNVARFTDAQLEYLAEYHSVDLSYTREGSFWFEDNER